MEITSHVKIGIVLFLQYEIQNWTVLFLHIDSWPFFYNCLFVEYDKPICQRCLRETIVTIAHTQYNEGRKNECDVQTNKYDV